MMSNEGYRDRLLSCRDCGQEFTFSAGEQEFYASKGLTNVPSRCPSCRAARRGNQSTASSPRPPRGESYQTTCATCGRPTSVPFIPREDRPVYCSDCFQAQRASRPRREDSRTYSNYGGSNSNSNSYNTNSYDNNSYDNGGGRDSRDRRDRRDANRDRRDNSW